MTNDTRYDMLEVLFFHGPAAAQEAMLGCLQEALVPYFEVEPLEFAHTNARSAGRVVRIAEVLGDSFHSAASFDRPLKDLAGEAFDWQRIGAVRAGMAATVCS